MNIFQRQLIMNDGRTLAEKYNDMRVCGYEMPTTTPRRVSIVEFERDVRPARARKVK